MMGSIHIGHPDVFTANPVACHHCVGIEPANCVVKNHAAEHFNLFLIVLLSPLVDHLLCQQYRCGSWQGVVFADNAGLSHLAGLDGKFNLVKQALGGGGWPGVLVDVIGTAK